MQSFISVLALVTLMEMMVFVGLGASIPDLLRTMKDGRLVLRAFLANYILVPVTTIFLLAMFRASPMVSDGFLLLAVCPGGAYGPPYTVIARGNTGEAAGLMILLAGLSPLLTPIALSLLLPFVPGNEDTLIGAGKLSGTLTVGQILPLFAGLLLQRFRPQLAAKLLLPAAHMTKILNAVFLCCVLYSQFDALTQIHLRGFVGMFFLLMISLVIGWFCGRRDIGSRKAMSLTTAVRNGAVGMVVATSAFAGTSVVTAAVVYGLFVVLGGLFAAIALGKWTQAADAPPEVMISVAS